MTPCCNRLSLALKPIIRYQHHVVLHALNKVTLNTIGKQGVPVMYVLTIDISNHISRIVIRHRSRRRLYHTD